LITRKHASSRRANLNSFTQGDRIMRAMLLDAPGKPLRLAEMQMPVPGAGEVLIRVEACGVCRTDLHIADGELPLQRSPLVPGHEIVGIVEQPGASRFAPGTRIGVPWLGGSCGSCEFCTKARENLCDAPTFTGYTRHGGYAEYTTAAERFCFPIPEQYDAAHAAPLLCAGLIGFRALAMAGDAKKLGLYGFGAAAHIVLQIARHQGRRVFAFTRPDDQRSQRFARELGAAWAGGSDAMPPEPLDAALIFAPVGALVPQALRAVKKGAVVVCAGIHMSDIPAFPYSSLWGERMLRSVANLTRADGEAFFALTATVPIATQVTTFPLERANEALQALRAGAIDGAAVLAIG
jgi:propanol-preferring alcohol dehydrogenase